MFGPPRRPGADKARSSELSTRSGLQDPVTAVPALSSRVVMTCPLAESARTDCRGEDGSVLMPLHDPGLRCRGLPCGVLRRRLLRLGRGTGQFLAADPDSGDRDEQG